MSSVQTAITARSAAKSTSDAERRVGHGAERAAAATGPRHTDVMASSRPQPKKIQPTWAAVMSSGNGAKASSVKKPML